MRPFKTKSLARVPSMTCYHDLHCLHFSEKIIFGHIAEIVIFTKQTHFDVIEN